MSEGKPGSGQKSEVKPVSKEEREKNKKELRKEMMEGLVDASQHNVEMEWKVRKLTENEKEHLMDIESVQRFLDLLYAVVLFAVLIYVADFFTFKLESMVDFAWMSFIPLGLFGFVNILYVIKKHDHIIWAIKADCDVSDGVVFARRFLFFGKHSGNLSGACSVYCSSAAGSSKIYRPFTTRFDYLWHFKKRSGAVILWIDGVENPERAFAVKMRY